MNGLITALKSAVLSHGRISCLKSNVGRVRQRIKNESAARAVTAAKVIPMYVKMPFRLNASEKIPTMTPTAKKKITVKDSPDPLAEWRKIPPKSPAIAPRFAPKNSAIAVTAVTVSSAVAPNGRM